MTTLLMILVAIVGIAQLVILLALAKGADKRERDLIKRTKDLEYEIKKQNRDYDSLFIENEFLKRENKRLKKEQEEDNEKLEVRMDGKLVDI